MTLGQRIRAIRRKKGLSLGDMERRTGLRRAHIRSLERNATSASLETLEKLAMGYNIGLQSFLGENGHRKEPTGSDQEKLIRTMAQLLARIDEPHRELLLATAERMSKRSALRTK